MTGSLRLLDHLLIRKEKDDDSTYLIAQALTQPRWYEVVVMVVGWWELVREWKRRKKKKSW